MTYHTKNQTLCLSRRFLMVMSLILSLVSVWPYPVAAAETTSLVSVAQTVAKLFRDVGDDRIAYRFMKTDGVSSDEVVIPEVKPTLKTYRADISAYTSTVEECDSDPFVTADGSIVKDGIIATNFLPFGTKVRIPKYFGDRIFTVHDRMNARYWYRIDIWMPFKKDALTWGVKRSAEIEVVEWGDGKTLWAGWTKTRLAEAQRQAQEELALLAKNAN